MLIGSDLWFNYGYYEFLAHCVLSVPSIVSVVVTSFLLPCWRQAQTVLCLCYYDAWSSFSTDPLSESCWGTKGQWGATVAFGNSWLLDYPVLDVTWTNIDPRLLERQASSRQVHNEARCLPSASQSLVLGHSRQRHSVGFPCQCNVTHRGLRKLWCSLSLCKMQQMAAG
jgi:hypothetical protein